jgi:hypothetical protein
MKPLRIGAKFRFSELHKRKMEVIAVLKRERDGKYRYLVRYEDDNQTVVIV